jgi:hypothetical protein
MFEKSDLLVKHNRGQGEPIHRRPRSEIALTFLEKFFEVSFLRSIWQKL